MAKRRNNIKVQNYRRDFSLDDRRAERWHKYAIESKSAVQIAKEEGVSVQRVYDDLRAVRDSMPEPDKAIISFRRLALIDKLIQDMLPEAHDGDSSAVNSIVKLLDREAKYLGLDAETKKEIKSALVYQILGLETSE